MSEQHEHEHDDSPAGAAAKPHDPRLDSSGEEHPAVQPLPFDLIALGNTRTGLWILGLGLATWSIARPFVDLISPAPTVFDGMTGWTLNTLAMVLLIPALLILAPTPHGPLPRWLAGCFAILSLAEMGNCIIHFYWLYSGVVPEGIASLIWFAFEVASRAVCLLLPWILWRYCQNRGLTGRAIVWLWIAMAGSVVGAVDIAFSWDHEAWNSRSFVAWGFVPLGLIAFFAARQTSRDVWLDALYRNTKFHALSKPNASVEPLRPAGDR